MGMRLVFSDCNTWLIRVLWLFLKGSCQEIFEIFIFN